MTHFTRPSYDDFNPAPRAQSVSARQEPSPDSVIDLTGTGPEGTVEAVVRVIGSQKIVPLSQYVKVHKEEEILWQEEE